MCIGENIRPDSDELTHVPPTRNLIFVDFTTEEITLGSKGELLKNSPIVIRKLSATCITNICRHTRKGREPLVLAAWIAGVPITALAIPDMGVRPIAADETLLCLLSGFFMRLVSTKATGFFQTLQFCIATKAGTYALLH